MFSSKCTLTPLPVSDGTLDTVQNTATEAVNPWRHRLRIVGAGRRIKVPPGCYRSHVDRDRWILTPDPNSRATTARDRIVIPLGVAAVIGVDVGDTVIVSHHLADGRVVVHAAGILNDAAEGIL
jgi:hypothetical protein